MSGIVVGLVGQPVAHSISPVFQQAAFDALGIDARYELWDTSPDDLPGRIASLRGHTVAGANVTVPYKQSVLALLDAVDATARRVGAVNTVVAAAGRLEGSNTDVAGFRRALRETGGYVASGSRALVLGAGGAARAVTLALELEGAAAVAVANRHPERAARLVDDLRADAGPSLVAVPWEEAVTGAYLRNVSLVINCTSLGLHGSVSAAESAVAAPAMHAGLFVCDIVANPIVTPLLRAARVAGARALGGLPMLVYQGAASFRLWTGREAPVSVMLRAAEQAMRRQAAAELNGQRFEG